ncbi:LacI family DNA-binding transcriptional regulator [Primorskyibacter sp. S187A]|uniref:LacI family DNA-binding transcriptional regulator n=1 Tax=Primorskyibacter sp. S187A TaxID=3415130 RepID=UPI003C79ED7F
MSKKADIIAVARAAKVSASTVSRSFNHPELVKPSTRKKIDRAVRKLGYIRNRAAQTIHGIRSGTVGVIVPTIDHTIFAELIQSVSDALEEQGFTILLASHGYDLQREYALTRKMLEHRVDAMALIGTAHAEETTDLLQRQNIPTLLLWNHGARAPFPCVGADNAETGRVIGAHIAALGHRDVAVLFPPVADNDRASQRLQGVEAALAEQGIVIHAPFRLETRYSVEAAKDAVAQLLEGRALPTALICGNDVLAWGALHGLRKAGLAVPQDMSVTGIGDFRGSRSFEPALTTVRIPARQIGARAAAMISQALQAPLEQRQSVRFAPELIVRETCRRCG